MNNLGMLWYEENAKLPFDESVKGAVACFRQRHGRLPLAIEAHPADLAGPVQIDGLMVRPSRVVKRPRHLFLVME